MEHGPEAHKQALLKRDHELAMIGTRAMDEKQAWPIDRRYAVRHQVNQRAINIDQATAWWVRAVQPKGAKLRDQAGRTDNNNQSNKKSSQMGAPRNRRSIAPSTSRVRLICGCTRKASERKSCAWAS